MRVGTRRPTPQEQHRSGKPALVIGVDLTEELRRQLPHFFEDYKLIELTSRKPERLYAESKKITRNMLRTYRPVFLVVNSISSDSAVLAAIVSSKLSRRTRKFYVVFWQSERFKVLRIP